MQAHLKTWLVGSFIAACAFGLGPLATAAVEGGPLQFSDLGGVRSWRAGGDAVVFVKSKTGQWYKAELAETCMKLDTKNGVNFLTETDPDSNRKVSKVVVDRHICEVTSLSKVDSPDITPAAAK